METSSPAEQLRAAGLRVTAIRLAVLRAVHENPHADVETVRSAVAGELGSVSVQSVYDALAVLSGAGLLRRLEPAGHPARYEVHLHDNHHHLACRACGAIVDVPCAVGEAPCLAPADTQGFVLDEAEVIYWGLCAACAPSS